jgi:hypothetical protein
MIEALKKMFGMDEETKAARAKVAEQERLEREKRMSQEKEALEKVVEAEKQDQ